MRRRSCRSIEALAALLAAGALASSCAAAAQEDVAAVYKVHEVRFVYRSFANMLDCGQLRQHVGAILLNLGARDDIKVRVSNCELFLMPDESPWRRSDPFGWPTDRYERLRDDRMQTSNVRIEVMFPVEATPDVMKEIEKDKSRRELVSRVTGNPLAALNDPIIFPAQRKRVTLSRATIRLRPEDCELLEQMIPTVFKQLDVKVLDKKVSCDSHRRSYFAPTVVVETLLPKGMPAAGEKKEEEKTVSPRREGEDEDRQEE
ncbi:MAG TPA: hypothetical protein VH814_22980 [Steroidobacteraceae bacterium]|jgi:hypothetical protein